MKRGAEDRGYLIWVVIVAVCLLASCFLPKETTTGEDPDGASIFRGRN